MFKSISLISFNVSFTRYILLASMLMLSCKWGSNHWNQFVWFKVLTGFHGVLLLSVMEIIIFLQ